MTTPEKHNALLAQGDVGKQQNTGQDDCNHNAGFMGDLVQRLQAIAQQNPGEAADTQRERIYAALQIGPLSTVQARRWLDVMHPAQRVLELRNLGAQIDTVWGVEPTECGRLHRMAQYVLVSKQDGFIAPDLAGLLALASVALMMLAGVLQ